MQTETCCLLAEKSLQSVYQIIPRKKALSAEHIEYINSFLNIHRRGIMKRLLVIAGIVSILILLAGAPAMASDDTTFTLGWGFGIPYGIIGGNFGYYVTPNVEVSLGVGLAFTTVGYSGGVKYYISPPVNDFRLRASVYYGTNTYVSSDYSAYYAAYSGVTAGFGGKYSMGDGRAIDFDLMYIVTSDAESYGYTIDNRTTISLGYIHEF
jgi:hypothetical protein